MKRHLFVCLFFTLFLGCKNRSPTAKELVTDYYAAFHTADFNQLLPLIGDSLVITEGEYAVVYSHDSFYEHFKWDSIFQPTYRVIELTETAEHVLALVSSSSRRYQFLKNDPLTCQYKFSFSQNKIAKIEVLECLNANWNIWEAERDSLVNWTKINHPELDGFINELSMNGAIKYLEAIAHYKNR